MEVGAFMGVNEAAAVMPLIMLANTFSGQKHFPGVDHWPREETGKLMITVAWCLLR